MQIEGWKTFPHCSIAEFIRELKNKNTNKNQRKLKKDYAQSESKLF